MKFKNPLLAVKDMPASIDFYKRVLGLCVIMDFGANVTLTGGVCLQTLDSWQEFLEGKPVLSGGNAGELYFEESDKGTPLGSAGRSFLRPGSPYH